MAKLIMLVGISYSGKSTVAEDLATKYRGIIVSSDAIRKELYGDESIQTDHTKVFDIAHKRIRDGLAANKVVIYDATNLNANRRINFLKSISHFNCEKICVPVISNLDSIYARMEIRDRQVPREVIERQIKQFQTPWYHEGWDIIEPVYNHNDNMNNSYSLKKMHCAQTAYHKTTHGMISR